MLKITSLFEYFKYPVWTIWQFLTNLPLAARNTVIVLSAFRRTVYLGYRVIPVLKKNRVTWSERTRGRYIWRVAQRFWANWILRRAEVSVEYVGFEHIDWSKGPYIIVSNHQSTLDPFPLIARIPNGRFVAKKEVLLYPVIGSAARYGAQAIVDRGNRRQAMPSIRKSLEAWSDANFIFFPEGTRSLDGKLKKFKAGAFRISQQFRIPILPVTISGAFESLPKGSLLRLERRPRIRVECGQPIFWRRSVPLLLAETRWAIQRMLDIARHSEGAIAS